MLEHALVVVLALAGGTLGALLRRAHRKLKAPERLEEHARIAVAYAEQLGGDGHTKLRTALAASLRLDRDANGRQDWTDAQHRIAIEAALARVGRTPSNG